MLENNIKLSDYISLIESDKGEYLSRANKKIIFEAKKESMLNACYDIYDRVGDIELPINSFKYLIKYYLSTPRYDIKKDKNTIPTICNILNRKPGKFLHEIINNLEDKILNNEINNDKKDIIKYIEQKYK